MVRRRAGVLNFTAPDRLADFVDDCPLIGRQGGSCSLGLGERCQRCNKQQAERRHCDRARRVRSKTNVHFTACATRLTVEHGSFRVGPKSGETPEMRGGHPPASSSKITASQSAASPDLFWTRNKLTVPPITDPPRQMYVEISSAAD